MGFYLINHNLYYVITSNTGKLYKQSGTTEPEITAGEPTVKAIFGRNKGFKS